jgi:outer membrane protein assembly factor BamB
MTTSLEDRLWNELEPAALRAQRGAPRARFPRPRVRGVVHTAVGLVALAAAAAAIGLLARPALQTRESAPAAGTVQTARVAGGLGDATVGFGAVWAYDTGGRVLRIDAASRRVTGRVAVPNPYLDAAVAAGAGAVWEVPVIRQHQVTAGDIAKPVTLVRIDPVSAAITARTPVRTAGGEPLVPHGVVARDDVVWVWGAGGAVRVDPASGRVVGTIRLAGDDPKGFALDGGSVWIAMEGGRLLRFDARTGARVASLGNQPTDHPFPLVALPGALVVDDEHGTVLARDAASGRTLWRASVPGGIRSAAADGDRLWILTASESDLRDELVALDPGSGRVTGRIALPDGGGRAVQAVGGALWVTNENGDIHIVNP